jgi:hypothetical protein
MGSRPRPGHDLRIVQIGGQRCDTFEVVDRDGFGAADALANEP